MESREIPVHQYHLRYSLSLHNHQKDSNDQNVSDKGSRKLNWNHTHDCRRWILGLRLIARQQRRYSSNERRRMMGSLRLLDAPLKTLDLPNYQYTLQILNTNDAVFMTTVPRRLFLHFFYQDSIDAKPNYKAQLWSSNQMGLAVTQEFGPLLWVWAGQLNSHLFFFFLLHFLKFNIIINNFYYLKNP